MGFACYGIIIIIIMGFAFLVIIDFVGLKIEIVKHTVEVFHFSWVGYDKTLLAICNSFFDGRLFVIHA
jgi:hypothetical protein